MAGSVNKAIIIGNLGRDPEIRTTQAGAKIANLTIATSERWTDKSSGEKRERTEWHRVSVWNERIADVVERFLSKGRKVYVEGQLQTRKWTDQQGLERYTTEIVIKPYVGNLVLLGNQRDGENPPAQSQHSTQRTQPNRTGSRSMSDAAGFDDDIPF